MSIFQKDCVDAGWSTDLMITTQQRVGTQEENIIL